MPSAQNVARRAVVALLGASAILAAGAGTAVADSVPGCDAVDITAVESQVATAMTAYFFTHPEVNEVFSRVQGDSKEDALKKTRAYLAANPEVQSAMNAIRGPVFDLRARCGIPVNNLIRGVL